MPKKYIKKDPKEVSEKRRLAGIKGAAATRLKWKILQQLSALEDHSRQDANGSIDRAN